LLLQLAAAAVSGCRLSGSATAPPMVPTTSSTAHAIANVSVMSQSGIYPNPNQDNQHAILIQTRIILQKSVIISKYGVTQSNSFGTLL
jgi:hypothetical protein